MTAALSPGVFFHSHINVQCVRFVFALLNACADSQTEVLASIFDITLLFPYVYFSWCKDTGGGGALQQCKYLKERHFNLILEVERGVSASGICGSVFIPSCECELVMCVCVCAHAQTLQSSCHRVLITTSHTCFPPRLSTAPNPPTELFMSRVSPSKADPAPVVASLFPVWFPWPPSSWPGSGSTAGHSPLVSVFHPKTVNHAIPKRESIMQLSKDS